MFAPCVLRRELIAFLFLLVSAGVPCVATIYLQGGVEFQLISATYLKLLLVLVSSTAICLTISMRARSTTAAVARCVLWLVFWNVLLGLACAVLAQSPELLGFAPLLAIAAVLHAAAVPALLCAASSLWTRRMARER